MNLSQNTLVEFESERVANTFIPPLASNSFYTIGSGVINLYCENNDIVNYLFLLKTMTGTLYVGDGEFLVGGESHYKTFDVKSSTTLINNGSLSIETSLNVYGTLVLQEGCTFGIGNNAKVYFYPGSKLIVEKDVHILNSGDINIYGELEVDVTMANSILDSESIYIDNSVLLKVDNIDLGDRTYSLQDYIESLTEIDINKYTQSQHSAGDGVVGYTWKAGYVKTHSQILEISVISGDVLLGDYKLPVLGQQEHLLPDQQIVQSLVIKNYSALHICKEYNGFTYLRPELYLGVVIDNVRTPASCNVFGDLVLDGIDSRIIIDRGACLTIEESGFMYIRNHAQLISSNNEGVVLIINGILVIDNIESITTFKPEQIEFGENGKVIIKNLYDDDHHVLFSTPNGIHDTDLYRLFEGRLEHIEYHVQSNCGIRIDEYFSNYSIFMRDWYNGLRIEKCIKDKLIIWHDGAFMELDNEVIPWATATSSLLHAARLFKTFGTHDIEKLQECVERLQYAESGNITFRFVEGNNVNEVTLILSTIEVESVTNHESEDTYSIYTDATGELFIKNMTNDTSIENLIDDNATVVHLNQGRTDFNL